MNAAGPMWLGLLGAQWLALCAAFFTLVLLSESFLGHYRTGFRVRMQYSPFVLGVLLLATFAVSVALPRTEWTLVALRVAGWSAIALAGVGAGFHYYWGVVMKPGGSRWLLHHLMYHAPLFAPLGLAVAGASALIVAASLAGGDVVARVSPSRGLALLTAVALLGLMLQIAILHYRGAFKNWLMYAPLVLPIPAIVGGMWTGVAGAGIAASQLAGRVYVVGLWVTFLTAFVGWGMHLRGLDRMMGGLYVTTPNLLEGPPPVAPLLMALLALEGIVGANLL